MEMKQDLQQTMEQHSSQLDLLNRNMPGGAHQCKNDHDLTLISMSDSFLSMFGYSRREIEVLFHNHFMEMVYPDDRAALAAATREQLKNGRDIELEYRVLCKNNKPVWVLDKARLLKDGRGDKTFYCLLIEISERKLAEEELRLTLERHQIIMDQATDIIFEWDIIEDTLSFSSNWYKKFGYEAIDSQISGRIPLSTNIHSEDTAAFVKIMKDTARGVPYSETEFRIKDVTGQYYWCRIRATTQLGLDGQPVKAVGVIVDIDREKKQKEVLLDMALKDALTGLYNKAAVNTLVEQRMKERGFTNVQALLILDVDYFKSVNDTYGHLAGDGLLSDVAEAIKGQIRDTDIAGRIGGDEFLIYLPDMESEAAASKKAKKLLEAIMHLSPGQGAPSISCSIGAAVSPQGAIGYYTLYKCADIALYARKKDGRGGVTFYDSSMSESSVIGTSVTGVGSDEGNVADEQLAQYAFRMLYAAKDTESTLNHLLEIIGRSYDVSRVYVFESSEDKTCCFNTFEWSGGGVEPLTETQQNISYVNYAGDYLNNFDHNGIFYWEKGKETHPAMGELLESRGIRSMLQCAMLDEGEFVGYIGFDECRDKRKWSTRQKAAFKLTADILSSFVVKLRQKQKLKMKL